MNRKLLSIALMVMMACGFTLRGQDVEQFVSRLIEQYPQARLLDIYKSCFQDYMGAEHLVGDPTTARAYLEQELETINSEALQPCYYEPCGIEGRFVRVSLRALQDGLISADALLDAFVRSANTEQPTVQQWSQRWHLIMAVIERMQLDLPQCEQDKQFIEDVLASGQYAISHSPEYREAYLPHYRIVRRDIFELELKPFLPCPNQQ